MSCNSALHADCASSVSAYSALRLAQNVPTLMGMAKRETVEIPQLRGNSLVGANIRRIRKERGLNLEDVAHELGTDSGNLSRLERGKQGYTDEGLRKLAKVLHTKVAEFFVERTDGEHLGPETVDVPSYRIPVFDAQASMGMGIVAYPERETVVGGLQLSETWVRANVGYSSVGNLAVISAFGDSMEPTFRDGDVILFDRGITQLRLDAVYVVSFKGELFIKRIQRRPDKSIVMKSDNALYDPYVVPTDELDQFRIVGKVVFAWNGKKM